MGRGLSIGHLTHVGSRRQRNEDAHAIYWEHPRVVETGRGPLFVVADGMGGHRAGHEASRMAVDQLWLYYEFPEERFHPLQTLDSLFKAANANILESGNRNEAYRRMGTTLSAFSLNAELTEGVIAHIGDSRVYRYQPGGGLIQVTTDHVRPDETHILSRRLGKNEEIEVELIEAPISVGDRWLLCSDGLTCDTTDEEIAELLQEVEDPQEVAMELVAYANREGRDNVTVVIVDVVER